MYIETEAVRELGLKGWAIGRAGCAQWLHNFQLLPSPHAEDGKWRIVPIETGAERNIQNDVSEKERDRAKSLFLSCCKVSGLRPEPS